VGVGEAGVLVGKIMEIEGGAVVVANLLLLITRSVMRSTVILFALEIAAAEVIIPMEEVIRPFRFSIFVTTS